MRFCVPAGLGSVEDNAAVHKKTSARAARPGYGRRMQTRAAAADAPHPVTAQDVRHAATRIRGRVLRTPALLNDAIARVTGAEVVLKLECLQPTGAYKERGAANKLAQLTPAERAAGVVAASSGNHAQAVARHASLSGIAAVI